MELSREIPPFGLRRLSCLNKQRNWEPSYRSPRSALTQNDDQDFNAMALAWAFLALSITLWRRACKRHLFLVSLGGQAPWVSLVLGELVAFSGRAEHGGRSSPWGNELSSSGHS